MKALLVNPINYHCQSTESHRSKKNHTLKYHTGLNSLSAILEAYGFIAPVLDLEIAEPDLETAVIREDPDVVGITATTANRFEAIDAAKTVKKLSADTTVVVGGPHFTFTAEDTLRNVPEIDAVVRGEGEMAMLELMQCLEGDSSIENVAGISFSANGEIVQNPDRTPVGDLDELPPINWEKVPWQNYDYSCFGRPCVHIQTSRGCPIGCTFCSVSKMWGKHLRWRSPSNVVDEIAHLLQKYNFRAVQFVDDTLTLNRRHLLSICEEIETRRLRFHWSCQTRVDAVNLRLLKTMKHAGCNSVALGVETGSQTMLDAIHKNITREQVLQTVRECKDVGLRCHAYFMYSLPGESDQDRRLTFELVEDLIRLGLDSFSINPTQIFPGTHVEEVARDRGILPPDFSWSAPYTNERHAAVQQGLAHTPLYMEDLSLDDLIQLGRRFEALQRPLRARSRRRQALKRVPDYMRSFASVKNMNDIKTRINRGRHTLTALANLARTSSGTERQ